MAIGTTVVRALESAADPERLGFVRPMAGDTRLLIQPGYRLRVVDLLLTNFHLPRSTLLALVCAFGGTERVLGAYRAAVEEGLPLLLVRRRHARRSRGLAVRGRVMRPTERFALPRGGHGRTRAHREADDGARRGRDPDVHAGRDAGEREDADARRGRGDRGRDRPRQHVPPVASPRAGGDSRRTGGSTASRAGLERCSPTPGASRRSRWGRGARGTLHSSPRRKKGSLSARTSTAPSIASRPKKRCASRAALGADIQMQLDVCPPGDSPRAVVEAAVAQTTRWARRALATDRPREQALFGIVQGACFADLRRAHAEELAGLDVNGGFDGLALGGFSVGEPIDRMYEALAVAAPALDPGATALPDGRRDAARSASRNRLRRGHVRLRPSDAQRQERPGAHPEWQDRRQASAVPPRHPARSTGVRLPDLPRRLLASVPPPPLHGGRDPRAAAPVSPQPSSLRRAHARGAGSDRARAVAGISRSLDDVLGLGRRLTVLWPSRAYVHRREEAARADPAPAEARVAARAR